MYSFPKRINESAKREFLEVYKGSELSRREFLKESTIIAASLGLPIIGASCTSPENPQLPEEGKLIYRPEIEVTYNRNVDKIQPYSRSKFIFILYELYNPGDHFKDEDTRSEEFLGFFRNGLKELECVDEHKYRCILKHVLVQTEDSHKKHSAYIKDPWLWDGSIGETANTTDGLSIEDAYEIEDYKFQILFKISQF